MANFVFVGSSDEPLVFTPLSDGVPLDGSIIIRAVFVANAYTADSAIDSDISWTDEGVFTIMLNNKLSKGVCESSLRLFYADSVDGTVVIHPNLSASLRLTIV